MFMGERLTGNNPEQDRLSPKAFVVEKALSIKPLKLERVEGATLEKGSKLESNGSWREAANVFYTVGRESNIVHERCDALISLSQNLINLGKFGQARETLKQVNEEAAVLKGRESMYFSARVLEKKAWIADYEGDFGDEANYLLVARDLIGEPQNKDEEDLVSTSVHFLGRATFGQAISIKDKNVRVGKLNQALGYFNSDLARFLKMREDGNPAPANEGFQYAWMARCYISLGELKKAEDYVHRAMENFKECELSHTGSGIMATGHVLEGGIALAKGRTRQARASFEEALIINYSKERYPKGEADALLGIAATFWAERNFGSAFVYGVRAVTIYPQALIRGVI